MFKKGNQMRKAIKTLTFFVALLGFAIIPLHAQSVFIPAQSQGATVAPSQAPQEQTEMIVTGQLVIIDPGNRTLTIRLADNTERQFAFDDNTVLRGTQDGVQGLSNGQPTMVAVHFTQDQQSGQDTATIIEILP